MKPQTEPLSRKKYNKYTIVDSDEEKEEETWHLVKYVTSNEYSIAKDNEIEIDENNKKKGIVKHRNKPYEVVILKTGDHDYIKSKADKYHRFEPIDTTSDERTREKRVKKFSMIEYKHLFYLLYKKKNF